MASPLHTIQQQGSLRSAGSDKSRFDNPERGMDRACIEQSYLIWFGVDLG